MARDPNNIHRLADYMEDVPNYITLPDLPPFSEPDYDLNDEKEVLAYLRDIEKTVRGSFEYQRMVKFMRENLDMNQCSFFSNVSNIDTTKIRIEIHHEPLSLYDITNTVFHKRSALGESLEVEYVAKEIAWNHYTMTVGLIPLSETVHDLVHNQYLFIPNDVVFGRWRTFVDQYHDWIPPEVLQALDSIQQLTDCCDCAEDYQYLLEKHYIYYDGTGNYKLPTVEEVQRMLRNHIDDMINKGDSSLVDKKPEEQPRYYNPIIILP